MRIKRLKQLYNSRKIFSLYIFHNKTVLTIILFCDGLAVLFTQSNSEEEYRIAYHKMCPFLRTGVDQDTNTEEAFKGFHTKFKGFVGTVKFMEILLVAL